MPYGTCHLCGRERRVHRRLEDGTAICSTCYSRIKPKEICDFCGQERRIDRRFPDGKRMCNLCYSHSRPKETCSICGQLKRVAERVSNEPVCANCYKRRSLKARWTRFKASTKARDNSRRERNIAILITKEEFRTLVEARCHYCGVLPDGCAHKYLGIDRIDNNLDYIPSNCVPCCWPCNKAKGTMTHDEFIAICRRVAAYQDTGVYVISSMDSSPSR